MWLSRAGERNDVLWGPRNAASGFTRSRDDGERQGHRHLEGKRYGERSEKERTATEKAEIEN